MAKKEFKRPDAPVASVASSPPSVAAVENPPPAPAQPPAVTPPAPAAKPVVKAGLACVDEDIFNEYIA